MHTTQLFQNYLIVVTQISICARCSLNARCLRSADQSAAKYILLGREDIAASMLCMADALQSKAAEQQGGQAPPVVQDSMPSIESTPISMLHTPQLRALSRITTGSGHSAPRSQKAGVHSAALWPCSVNGTPVQPVVGHNVCEQWSSRCGTPLLSSVSAVLLVLQATAHCARQCEASDRWQHSRPRFSYSDVNDGALRLMRIYSRDMVSTKALRESPGVAYGGVSRSASSGSNSSICGAHDCVQVCAWDD